jgi:hypothetical protein
MVLLVSYAVDFGYFFLAAANLTTAARSGVEYSIQGYQSAGQSALPVAGPITSTASVAALAVGDFSNFLNSSTTTTVEVCTKALGMNGSVPNCGSFGPTAASYTPSADPEAPAFTLQRVDVTYTVQPPIPMSFFSVSLLPQMQFHRQVSMRALD